MNTYTYVGGNPLQYIDPFGLDSIVVNTATGTTSYLDDNGNTVASVPHRSGVGGVTDPTVEGRGPTPPGNYRIDQAPAVMPNTDQNRPFCDPSGNCWWIPYVPEFETPNNRCLPSSQGGTGRCGMHPDGNVPGTQGCTGLTDANTTNFRELIEQYNPSPDNPLPVVVQ